MKIVRPAGEINPISISGDLPRKQPAAGQQHAKGCRTQPPRARSDARPADRSGRCSSPPCTYEAFRSQGSRLETRLARPQWIGPTRATHFRSHTSASFSTARLSARRTSPPPRPTASNDTRPCSDEVPPPLTPPVDNQSSAAPISAPGLRAQKLFASDQDEPLRSGIGSSEESIATDPPRLPHRFDHPAICRACLSRRKSGAGEQIGPAASRQAWHECALRPSMR